MAELEAVLAKLRASLKQRGAVGIGGLGRHFRIFDKDRHKDGPGSGLLDPEEFVHLVQVNQLGLDDASLNVLLRAFDRDGSGLIDYEEFLYRVRGSLSPAREKVVKEVFVTLDKIGGGGGYLSLATVRPFYDASLHPEVIKGEKTADEVLREFLSGFEGSQGERDGIVLPEEWIRYYEEVSMSIDSDQYFVTMLANTWAHLAIATPVDGSELGASLAREARIGLSTGPVPKAAGFAINNSPVNPMSLPPSSAGLPGVSVAHASFSARFAKDKDEKGAPPSSRFHPDDMGLPGGHIVPHPLATRLLEQPPPTKPKPAMKTMSPTKRYHPPSGFSTQNSAPVAGALLAPPPAVLPSQPSLTKPLVRKLAKDSAARLHFSALHYDNHFVTTQSYVQADLLAAHAATLALPPTPGAGLPNTHHTRTKTYGATAASVPIAPVVPNNAEKLQPAPPPPEPAAAPYNPPVLSAYPRNHLVSATGKAAPATVWPASAGGAGGGAAPMHAGSRYAAADAIGDPAAFASYYMNPTAAASYHAPPPVSPAPPAGVAVQPTVGSGTAFTWVMPTSTSAAGHLARVDAALTAPPPHEVPAEQKSDMYRSTLRVEMPKPQFGGLQAKVLRPENHAAGYATAAGSHIFG